ncbi:MAG: oxidoreductase [Nitrososphaerota archaeon]
MSMRPKVAFYWCASCGGCEEAVVDLGEKILDVVNLVDIVFWPVAMDFKIPDIEAMPDGSITVSFINGGVRLSEHEEIVKLLRRKSMLIVAYGACACWGGIPGLANNYRREEILERAYITTPTTVNPEKIIPSQTRPVEINGAKIDLPEFLPSLKPLDEVITVDYYVPGCPPTPEVTWEAINILLSGKLPSKGSVIGASNKSLCNECPLNDTKPENVLIKEFKRVVHFVPDPNQCLLVQGLPCLGPVTRGGCSALCIKANMPCTGCFGPLDNIHDYGGKAISFLGSILDLEDEEQIRKEISKLPDILGLIYKYSLPKSGLRNILRSVRK